MNIRSSVVEMAAISCMVFFCFPSAANSVFIAPNGNNSNTGSGSAPLESLEAALMKISAGDTIHIASGTYYCTATIPLDKNGTSEARFTLLGELDDRPVFDFSAMPLASANQGMKLRGNFWFIKGIIIKGAGDNGLLIQGGSDNIVEFCDFTQNRDTGCQLKGGAANNRIINCDSYDNRDPDEGDADGFAPKMDVGSDNVFIGCRAWRNSDDGWDGYLRGTDNVSTTLINCWCFKNGYRADGSASTGNGNGFKMGGSDDKKLKHDFTLIRCLAFGNRVKGFDQNNNRGAMTLYNCTAFSNGINYSIDGGSSTLVIKNSIASGSGSNRLSGGMQAANSFSAPQSHFMSVQPDDAWRPRKADGTLPDITFMHLTDNSDMIDAGEMIEGVEYSGDKPDLGCFEFEPSTSAVYKHGAYASTSLIRKRYIPSSIYTLAGRRISPSTPQLDITTGLYLKSSGTRAGPHLQMDGCVGEVHSTP